MRLILIIYFLFNIFACAKNTTILSSNSLVSFGTDKTLDIITWNIEHFPKKDLTITYVKEAIDSIDTIEFDLPTKPYIRILMNSDDYSVTNAKHVESVLRNKYKPEGLFIEVDINDTVDDLSLSGKADNVTDLKGQQDLLKQYFSKRPTVSDQEVEEVLAIHKDFYDTSATEEYDTYGGRKWRINKIIFDNVFSYGPNNVINFDKIKGLTGIFSPNASGKSSILYAILQGFFNSSNRTGGRNVADVIHKNKDEGFI